MARGGRPTGPALARCRPRESPNDPMVVPRSGRPAYGRPPGASNGSVRARAIMCRCIGYLSLDGRLSPRTIASTDRDASDGMALLIEPLTARPHPRPRHALRPGRRPEMVLVLPGSGSAGATGPTRRPAENRELLETAAKEQDHAPGLVAYDDDAVVGWVSLGPREDYERLAYSKVLAPLDDKPVWSIVCFVVGRRSRGQGVAAGLLGAAIDYARDHGATTLEAYPVDVAERRADRLGERVPRHARHVRAGRVSRSSRAARAARTPRRARSCARRSGPDPSMSGGAVEPASPPLRHPSRAGHRHPTTLTWPSPNA